MRCLSWFGFTAVLASLVLGGAAGDQAAEKEVGALPSSYDRYPGTATIARVEKATPADGSAGRAREGYRVWFTFQPSGKPSRVVKEALAGLARPKGYEFRLANGWLAGPRYLKKYGIAKGKQFGATLLVITRGTSTPVILQLDDVKQDDYFESASTPSR
jgi:hypothetical protein